MQFAPSFVRSYVLLTFQLRFERLYKPDATVNTAIARTRSSTGFEHLALGEGGEEDGPWCAMGGHAVGEGLDRVDAYGAVNGVAHRAAVCALVSCTGHALTW